MKRVKFFVDFPLQIAYNPAFINSFKEGLWLSQNQKSDDFINKFINDVTQRLL
jgi:hypothetical protein